MGALLNLARGSNADIEHAARANAFEGQWREFESLLAVVGPVFNVTVTEYELIREAARRDLPAALEAYRDMAKQIEANRC